MPTQSENVFAVFEQLAGVTSGTVGDFPTPDQIVRDIEIAGLVFISSVPGPARIVMHSLAQMLIGLHSNQMTAASVIVLIQAARTDPSVYGFIDAFVGILNGVIQKFGAKNSQTVLYVHAIGNGLLKAGF